MGSPVFVWHNGTFMLRTHEQRHIDNWSKESGATIVPEHLAKLAPRMLEALGRLEWSGTDSAEEPVCPECNCWDDLGHAKDCALGALPTEARGGDQAPTKPFKCAVCAKAIRVEADYEPQYCCPGTIQYE